MPYTRRISVADAADTGYPDYQAVFVASPESTTVLAGFLGNGGHPPLHTHDVDLFFVILEGSATVRLGHGEHQAKAGEVIYIPAGFPHGSNNQSGAAEHHLEILIPGIRPGSPLSEAGRICRWGPATRGHAVRQKQHGPANGDDQS